MAESIVPANNNGYERTLKWTNLSQAVVALIQLLLDGRTAVVTLCFIKRGNGFALGL